MLLYLTILRGNFTLPYFRNWYIYRNAIVKLASFYFLIDSTRYLSIFKILIIFHSFDIFVFIIPYCKQMLKKGVEKRPAFIFISFTLAFLVGILWNITFVASKIIREPSYNIDKRSFNNRTCHYI